MLKTLLHGRAAAYALAGVLPVTALLATAALAPSGLGIVSAAHAQTSGSTASDTAFVRALGAKLTAVVNGSGSVAEKKTQILPLLSNDVDVDSIGRFCLGRFWNTASPAQQQRYLTLFHQVLTNTITGKLGDYKGVGIAVGQANSQDGKTYVPTTITRPGQPPAAVQWVVSDASGAPKVVDVVAEGVSLSLTQRSDYASYLAHNGNNVDALLNALTRQVSRAS